MYRLSLLLLLGASTAPAAIKVLIIDGQNNHAWKDTTPVLKKALEDTGLFEVDVATSPAKGQDMRPGVRKVRGDTGRLEVDVARSPAKGQDMSGFHPDFGKYRVVVSNYNGQPWPAETSAAFEKFVREGGGFVSYHAADNSFPDW